VPAVLIPFPAATDNHQFHNARAFANTGAARVLEQNSATPESLAQLVSEFISNTAAREEIRGALATWHRPDAADLIASEILTGADSPVAVGANPQPGPGRGQTNIPKVERQEFSAV
jgi:UDP-N-acetylglucosamine--N-acetylmuramyl-(pentapeptide) pyrophosphoryl-undecaprenol N-acetylglucosamine transferase